MNVHFPVYQETHHVTNCLHDHNSSSKLLGGMRSQAATAEAKNEQPETLQDKLQNMEVSLEQWRTSRETLGVGDGLNGKGDGFSEEGRETLVQLPLENNNGIGASEIKGSSLVGALLNTFAVPAEIKQKFLSLKGIQGRRKVTTMSELSAKGQKEKEHFFGQTQTKQLYKRIWEWLQIRGAVKSQEQSIQTTDKSYLEGEYLLDSYDRNGEYRQLERKGIFEEGLDKRA